MVRGTLLLSLLLFTSCSSMPWQSDAPKPVEGGLLTFVPAAEKRPIEEARAQRAEVIEKLAIARRDLEQVESRQALAENDEKVMKQRVGEARDKVEHARRYGTREELQSAQEHLGTAQKGARLARTKTHYYQDLEGLAQHMVELQETTLELADARVQLREADAISRLDRPAAQEVDVESYREQVRRLEDEVAMIQVEARAARTRVELRRQLFDDRARAVPASFRLNEPEEIDQILSLQLEDGDSWMKTSSGQRGDRK